MMIAVRYIRHDAPVEAYTVVVGSKTTKTIGVVARRQVDNRWDVLPPGCDLRTEIVRSRADAVAALMDHAGID